MSHSDDEHKIYPPGQWPENMADMIRDWNPTSHTLQRSCVVCHQPEPDPMRFYVCTDDSMGWENATICKPCYARHVLAHYPDGRLAGHIREHPEEYDL